MTTASVLSVWETRGFAIEEHELALRWATLVKHSQFRIVVFLCQTGAEEILLVYKSESDVPAFAIQRLRTAVVLIDCLGMTIRFRSLAEALLAMSPVSKSDRHELLHGPRPACIRVLPQSLIGQRRSFACHIISAFRSTRSWAARLALQ